MNFKTQSKQKQGRVLRWAAALLTCATTTAIALPAMAGVQKTSAEFGAYIEDAMVYPNSTAQQYGEWSESRNLFSKSDWWGNSTFGAGYSTYGNTSASKNSRSASTNASSGLTTDIKIFGNNVDIVDIYTSAYTRMRPAAKGASFSVYVGNSQVYSASSSATAGWNWSQNLFSWNYSQTFYPGGYPVKVTAGVTGSASLGYYAGVQPTFMRASLTGRAGLYAQAKGEVGVWWLLGAAAWANLTLVEPSVNVNAVQSWDLQPSGGRCAVTFWRGTNAALTVKSLAGNVKAQAQVAGGTFTSTVFSWSGFNTTYNLLPNTMTARVVTDNFACPTVGN